MSGLLQRLRSQSGWRLHWRRRRKAQGDCEYQTCCCEWPGRTRPNSMHKWSHSVGLITLITPTRFLQLPPPQLPLGRPQASYRTYDSLTILKLVNQLDYLSSLKAGWRRRGISLLDKKSLKKLRLPNLLNLLGSRQPRICRVWPSLL